MPVDVKPSGEHEAGFDSGTSESGIAARTIDGAVVTIAGRFSLAVVQFVSTIVLARLLSPDDFGLVAMVAPVAIVMSLFRDAGLSTATTQAKELTHEQVSGLFWANVALGALFTVILCVCAPYLVRFFGRDEIYALTFVYAGTMFLSSISVQHEALLRRQMEFRKLAVINLWVTSLSTIIAIVSAWVGLGYWALVAMAYCNAVFMIIATWCAVRWRPGPPRRNAGVRKLAHFGGYVAGGNLLYLVSENAVPVIIGRTMGAHDLGLFGRAARLAEMIVDQVAAPVSQVVLPAMSKLQDDRARLKRAVSQVLEKITILTVAMAGLLVVVGSDLVPLLFGEQWARAGRVVQILATGALVWPISRVLASTMISLGHSREMLVWSSISLALKLVALAIGVTYGLLGVATAIALSQWIGLIIFSLFVSRYAPIALADIVRWTRVAASAGGVAVASGLLVRTILPVGSSWNVLIILSAAFLLAYGGTIVSTKAGRALVVDLRSMAQRILGKVTT